MALGVGLCNPPGGGGGGGWGVCPETELLAGTLVPGACFSEGKQAQRQQVVGWRLPSKAVGVGLWTAVALGQLIHSPPPPPPVLHRWGDHFRCPVGTEVADQIHGLPKTLLLDGLPGWAARLGEVGLVRRPPGRGGEGPMGTEDGRAVSVKGRKPGGASPLRHVPPSPAGRSVSEGRRVDGVRWSWGGRNGSTDTALR